MAEDGAALKELVPEDLKRRVAVATITAALTDDTPSEHDVAQTRALKGLDFAMRIDGEGYNTYAIGSIQTGLHESAISRLQDRARQQSVSDDICYVANFDKSAEPIALVLPAGVGRRFRDDVSQFLSDLKSMLPAAFNSDEFRQQSTELTSSLQERQMEDTRALQEQADAMGLVMLPTPNGFVFAPQRDGKVMEQEDFMALPDAEKQKIADAIETMNKRLMDMLRRYPEIQEKLIAAQRQLAEETARRVLTSQSARLRARYQIYEPVIAHLTRMVNQMLTSLDQLMLLIRPAQGQMQGPFQGMTPDRLLDPYQVNLLVDRSNEQGAPVVYESNPSLDNLVGKLEHRLEYGVPVTDFSMIRPGALHRANGGYLVLDADRIIQKPFAWEALKRALLDGCVRIESVSQLMSLAYSISLDPAPIKLRMKVVLLGSRRLYHLLRQYDSDFDSLFKILADFSDDVDWDETNEKAFARVIAEFGTGAGLKPADPEAIARVLEHGSRLVGDRRRLSTHVKSLFDLLREANQFTLEQDAERISGDHVQQAISERDFRVDRIRELIQENIERGITVVETRGMRSGQINGLSVMQIGKLMFGQPSRITATARLGSGELIDIERESKLGGNIHSKAVMIVSNFIGYRYAREHPLSLHASLVFEQSYGGVEGDSASIAETCALLSAIIDQPIRQDLAVTGSMDQHGTVQAIGGVNQKIEGFYDVCATGGLTGTQGVIIPASNVDNLMLRDDVIADVSAGRFHIYAMSRVDDAMALLFGTPDQPADVQQIDDRVRDRLQTLHAIWIRSRGGQKQDDQG